jgi:hypothetical protein
MEDAEAIALLLCNCVDASDEGSLVRILDFFGIPWSGLPPTEASADLVASHTAGRAKFSILASAANLAKLLHQSGQSKVPEWIKDASSVFVYGFRATGEDRNLLRTITGDCSADIHDLSAQSVSASVTADFSDLCGPMSGIQAGLQPGATHSVLTVHPPAGKEFQPIITAPEGQLFLKIRFARQSFFLDGSHSIVDINQRSASSFDVRKFFAGVVPLVMYLNWSFRNVCLTHRATNACLIIDDPLLRERYGFLDYQELLQMMEKQEFATSVAFIPWNWRRTSHQAIDAFRKNTEKLSVCVHGCDHTGGEFSTDSAALLDAIVKTAKHRMNSLLERTGLDYDQVMVFPQGEFSSEACIALKRHGFIAAVNTEVAPVMNGSNETTIEDLWSVAILRYGEFPIFTRRYISHGLENFAFDGLLGKPCLVAGHHDLFRDHGRTLSEFVARLNALNWKLSWRTVGNAVCRSYTLHHRHGSVLLKMFAGRLILESREAAQHLIVSKQESDVNAITSVTVNGESLDYSFQNGCLQFALDLLPERTLEIRCNYREDAGTCTLSEPISTRARVAARRYLSEFRDNYLVGNHFVLRASSAAKRLLN